MDDKNMKTFVLELYSGRQIFGQAKTKKDFIHTFLCEEAYFNTKRTDIKSCICLPPLFIPIAKELYYENRTR